MRSRLASARRTVFWALLAEQRMWLVALLVVGLAVFGVALGTAGAIRDAIDLAVIDRSEPLERYVSALVFLAVAGLGAGFGLRQVAARIAYHLEFRLRTRLYERLQALDPRTLDTLATGQLVTRAITDLSLLELLILIVPIFVVSIILLTALAVVVIVQSPVMALVALGGIPVNAWLVIRIRRRLYGMSWVALNRRAEVTTTIDEAVRGIRVVKAFGREDHERGRVRAAAQSAYAVALNRIRLVARYDLLLRPIPILLNAMQLVVAGRLLGEGFTVGRLLILLAYARVFTEFAQSFDEIASAWQFAKAGAQRINELMERVAPQASGGAPLPPPAGGLAFSGVGFGSDGRTILHSLDLTVAPGELTVLVGAPGAGKSLVAALASAAATPTEGSVRLDGADVSTLDVLALRRAVRVLGEEPFLFGRTVRENLEMGAGGGRLPDDAFVPALRAAAAEEFVGRLSGGLDTVLGDRGMTLSGGQRQRLALARALVDPPRVLVLDDALSAVNPALEIDIVRHVRAHAPQTAILWITRREGPARLADRVVRLPARAPAVQQPPAEQPAADGLAALGGIVDPKLLQAIANVPADRDEPDVSDDEATAASQPPTVWSMLRPLRGRLAQAVAALVAFTLAGLVPIALFRIAIDDFRGGGHAQADLVALAIVGIASLVGVLNYAFRMASGRVNEGVLYLLRRRVFQRLSVLGIDFYDRELPGQVAARVVFDLDRISQFLESAAYQIAVGVAVIVMAIGAIVVWDASVAVAVIGFVPLMLAVSLLQLPVASRAYDRQRQRMGSVVERLEEDVGGRYVIDAFGVRDRARTAFSERALSLRSARRRTATIANGYVEVMNMLGNVAAAVLIWRAGTLALGDRISVGSMVALQLYLASALAPIPLLSDAIQRFLAARASLRTLRQPFHAEIRPAEAGTAGECSGLRGALALDGLRFAYPGTGVEVLHEVDLAIPAGGSVALVGPTGAGKSSIAKLVARIYDPDAGSVRADGTDVREWTLESYRRRLGTVPQDAFCFRGTVLQNVAYGRPDATPSQAEEAIRAAGVEGVLATLPSGLFTPVEEEGRNLTAAQRQGIAIARAVLVHPDVLILDEATSSLDEAAEEAVLDAVRRLERTTIFVTHRLSVASRADKVVVVEDGRIVEHGSHDELAGADGPYSRLWAVGPDVEPAAAT